MYLSIVTLLERHSDCVCFSETWRNHVQGAAVQHCVRTHSEQSALNTGVCVCVCLLSGVFLTLSRVPDRMLSVLQICWPASALHVYSGPDSVCIAAVFISSLFIVNPAVIRLRLYQRQDGECSEHAQANKKKLLRHVCCGLLFLLSVNH